MSTSGIAIRIIRAGRPALGLAILVVGGVIWEMNSTPTARMLDGREPSRKGWAPGRPTSPRVDGSIMLPGDRGEHSANAYFGLKPRERLQVQAFLKSLAATDDVPA